MKPERMRPERLQEIKNRGYRRRAISPNDWVTILKDVKDLITAYETSQQEEVAETDVVGDGVLIEISERFPNMEDSKAYIYILDLRKQLAASQAEVERLQDVLDNAKESVKWN